MISDEAIARIVDIAELHGGSSDRPGSGLPLRDLVRQSRYREVRPQLTSARVEQYLREHPADVDKWVQWCEDKRTSGGWGISVREGRWQIGRHEDLEGLPYRKLPDSFADGPSAVAEYILRELDFWVEVSDQSEKESAENRTA